MLEAALLLEVGDLLLHRRQRLLDGGEGLQHLALGLLRLGARGGFEPLTLHEVAVLLLGGAELLAEPGERRLRGRELRPEFGAHGREPRLVLGREESGVGTRGGLGAASARDDEADDPAEHEADGESEDQGERRIHV